MSFGSLAAVPAAPRTAADLPVRPQVVTPVPLESLVRTADATLLRPARAHDDNPGVTGVTVDSRAVQPGDMYAALAGANVHGARFCADAAAAGAVAVLTDEAGAPSATASGVPALVVADPRGCLGPVSALVYGYPAQALTLVAITGTSGKTTTAHLVEAGVAASGLTAARIGTTGTAVDGTPLVSRLTTPEAPELQALFALMRERAVDTCAMEVSSHSLVLGRVDGVVFDVAAFTNLGRDHLDFHADEEDYFAAKAQLFTPQRSRRAVVNVDDESGRRIVATRALPVRTVSAAGAPADWRCRDAKADRTGTAFTVEGPDSRLHSCRVRLPGAFNVANALLAIAACTEAGLPVDPVVDAIADLRSVPGRMESVDEGQDFTVVVDYAHKPDALTAVLDQLRAVTPGRLLVVLGAGGDRDTGKRAVMGELAARLADLVVITDDNPRSEDPAAIRAALLDGTGAAPPAERAHVLEVADRAQAIEAALAAARAGDCVLVAGKGHEQGQHMDGRSEPFDDRVVARAALSRRST